MSQTAGILENVLSTFSGTVFDIQVLDLYQDGDSERHYRISWQVVCEGATSPKKEIQLPYSEVLPSPPELSHEMKKAGANLALNQAVLWKEGDVVVIAFEDTPLDDPEHRVEWHTKLKSFNPKAWTSSH